MSNEERGLVERPSFLPTDASAEELGTDLMNQYCQPPRLKIIQGMTSKPFKPPFTERDAIIIPQMKKIGDDNEPFTFTPIFFFPSWAVWNPIKMRGTLPAVRDFTFEAGSEIAQKARRFTKEPCPENPDEKLRYCEHLNFYCILHDFEEFTDFPIIFPFVRGEYKTGQLIIGLVQTRPKAPPYSCRFSARVAEHTGKEGTWYGLDVIDDTQRWVTEDQYYKYQKLHNDLKKLVDARAVQIDHSDSDVVDPETANDF